MGMAVAEGVAECGKCDTDAGSLLRFHHAVWTSLCSSSADAIDKERSSSDLSMGRWPVANCATALRHCARAVRRTRRQALEGKRRAVADGGEPGAEVVVVEGGDFGFVGDQPRDAHDLVVVAGVVAEAAGGKDDAGERRSLRVD